MVIYYDNILSNLIAKANRGEGLTRKAMFMLCKLTEWMQSDKEVC